jgi:hypothetical protein
MVVLYLSNCQDTGEISLGNSFTEFIMYDGKEVICVDIERDGYTVRIVLILEASHKKNHIGT